MDVLAQCQFLIGLTRQLKQLIQYCGTTTVAAPRVLYGEATGGNSYLVGPDAYARLLFADLYPGADPSTPANQLIIANIIQALNQLLRP
jgi:hypothetical protein